MSLETFKRLSFLLHKRTIFQYSDNMLTHLGIPHLKKEYVKISTCLYSELYDILKVVS